MKERSCADKKGDRMKEGWKEFKQASKKERKKVPVGVV